MLHAPTDKLRLCFTKFVQKEHLQWPRRQFVIFYNADFMRFIKALKKLTIFFTFIYKVLP